MESLFTVFSNKDSGKIYYQNYPERIIEKITTRVNYTTETMSKLIATLINQQKTVLHQSYKTILYDGMKLE